MSKETRAVESGLTDQALDGVKCTKSGAAEIAELAQQAMAPVQLLPGEVFALLDADGGVSVVDTDTYAFSPRRVTAQRTVTDAVSFCAYMAKHGTPLSEVWADTPGSTVVGVIDAPLGAGKAAGWERHRVRLALTKSVPWLAWEEFNGQWMAPLEFAEFIEIRALDVREPDTASLLDLAQHFTAHRSVQFESSEKLKDGETKLHYAETIIGKAGVKGDVAIPDVLKLVLKPYIGGPSYYVWARFRYRLNGAQLALGYVLERPQEILDLAFSDIVDEIRDGKPETPSQEATDATPFRLGTSGHPGVDQPIFYGKP